MYSTWILSQKWKTIEKKLIHSVSKKLSCFILNCRQIQQVPVLFIIQKYEQYMYVQ